MFPLPQQLDLSHVRLNLPAEICAKWFLTLFILMTRQSPSSAPERFKLSFKPLMQLMMQSALKKRSYEMSEPKREEPLLCAWLVLWYLQRSPFPSSPIQSSPIQSSPPAPYQEDLLPLHTPCKCLAEVLHQMFSCWQPPAFHRSFGSHMAPSVQGLLSNPAAPFRPITSTWTHSSGTFPMPMGSSDGFHSFRFQVFLIVYQDFPPLPGWKCNTEQMENSISMRLNKELVMQWERISACNSGQQLCVTPCISTGWNWSCQTPSLIQNYHYSAWDKSEITKLLPRKPNSAYDEMTHCKHRVPGVQQCIQAKDLLQLDSTFLPAETAKNLWFSFSYPDTKRLKSARLRGAICSV